MSARANKAALALAMLIAAPAAADPPPIDHQALEPQAVEPILPGRRRPGVQPVLPEAPPIAIDLELLPDGSISGGPQHLGAAVAEE